MFKFMQMMNGVLLPPKLYLLDYFFLSLGAKNVVVVYILCVKNEKDAVFSPGLRCNLDKVRVVLFDSLFVAGSKYIV